MRLLKSIKPKATDDQLVFQSFDMFPINLTTIEDETSMMYFCQKYLVMTLILFLFFKNIRFNDKIYCRVKGFFVEANLHPNHLFQGVSQANSTMGVIPANTQLQTALSVRAATEAQRAHVELSISTPNGSLMLIKY